MGYDISDDPQGEDERTDGDRQGGITEDHIALQNQSSVKADDYPKEEREAQSLVRQPR